MDIIQFLIDETWKFLNKFIATPASGKGFGMPWSLEEIIRAESTHFLQSCFWGYVALCLSTSIISSYSNYRWCARSTYLFGLSVGLFVSVSVHIYIDAYTVLA